MKTITWLILCCISIPISSASEMGNKGIAGNIETLTENQSASIQITTHFYRSITASTDGDRERFEREYLKILRKAPEMAMNVDAALKLRREGIVDSELARLEPHFEILESKIVLKINNHRNKYEYFHVALTVEINTQGGDCSVAAYKGSSILAGAFTNEREDVPAPAAVLKMGAEDLKEIGKLLKERVDNKIAECEAIEQTRLFN